MHVLILGGGGMVGRKLAERLAKDGTLGGREIAKLTLHDVVEPQAPAGAPFPIATSLTITPSTTYSGCALPRIEEMPRMRTRFPPPGAPVLVEICAPAILPWNACSMLCVETLVTSSALTPATEFGKLRRAMPVACPVITT